MMALDNPPLFDVMRKLLRFSKSRWGICIDLDRLSNVGLPYSGSDYRTECMNKFPMQIKNGTVLHAAVTQEYPQPLRLN